GAAPKPGVNVAIGALLRFESAIKDAGPGELDPLALGSRDVRRGLVEILTNDGQLAPASHVHHIAREHAKIDHLAYGALQGRPARLDRGARLAHANLFRADRKGERLAP